MPDTLHALAMFAAAFAAGAVNAVAGGGSLITFPVLVALGLPPILANTTSTVGLVPGSLASAWGYREELGEVRPWLARLVPPSVVGGLVGALLLLWTPPRVFDLLVPLLVLGATVLFAASDRIARMVVRKTGEQEDTRPAALVAFAQLGIAIYGGYFGAGIGILMLAALALLHLGDIHRANALKALLGSSINAFAAGLFIARGSVLWGPAIVMVAGSIAGGYGAARIARRMEARVVRRLVVASGVAATVWLAVQAFGR